MATPQWIRLTTYLCDDFDGMIVHEVMPRLAYTYLIREDVTLEMKGSIYTRTDYARCIAKFYIIFTANILKTRISKNIIRLTLGSMGKTMSASLNNLKHTVRPHASLDSIWTWFDLEKDDESAHWRLFLKDELNLSLSEILGFDAAGNDSDEDMPDAPSKKRPLEEPMAAAATSPVVEPPQKKMRLIDQMDQLAKVTHLNVYLLAFLAPYAKRTKRFYQFRILAGEQGPFLAWARSALNVLAASELYALLGCFYGSVTEKEMAAACPGRPKEAKMLLEELIRSLSNCTCFIKQLEQPPVGDVVQYLCYFED
jgi:hypothetical protein